eukprot:Rmarinus@m.2212
MARIIRADPQKLDDTIGDGRRVALAISGGEESEYEFDWTRSNILGPHDVLVFVTSVTENRNDNEAVDVLTRYGQRAKDLGIRSVQVKLNCDLTPHVPALVHLMEAEHVDLVVLGSSDKGLVSRFLVGSVSEEAVHAIHIPVVICKRRKICSGTFENNYEDASGPRKIVMGLDNSTGSQFAFSWAIDNIVRKTDEILLVHVDKKSSDKYQNLDEDPLTIFASRCYDRNFNCATLRITGEKIGPALCKVVEENGADALIVGSRELNKAQRLILRSVGDHLLHHCHCPVVLAKKPKHRLLNTGTSNAL